MCRVLERCFAGCSLPHRGRPTVRVDDVDIEPTRRLEASDAIRFFGNDAIVPAGGRTNQRSYRLRCFAEGEQVPSTTEISSTYAINPATVLKGMNLLVDQGLLEKRRGLGVFVTTGAREKARDAKREELLTTRVVELVAQAKALGISCEQLQRIIGRTYR
mgnify:CR=1 FL=1